jgi:hypothetical protein
MVPGQLCLRCLALTLLFVFQAAATQAGPLVPISDATALATGDWPAHRQLVSHTGFQACELAAVTEAGTADKRPYTAHRRRQEIAVSGESRARGGAARVTIMIFPPAELARAYCAALVEVFLFPGRNDPAGHGPA